MYAFDKRTRRWLVWAALWVFVGLTLFYYGDARLTAAREDTRYMDGLQRQVRDMSEGMHAYENVRQHLPWALDGEIHRQNMDLSLRIGPREHARLNDILHTTYAADGVFLPEHFVLKKEADGALRINMTGKKLIPVAQPEHTP